MGVTGRAGELALERGEGVDDGRCLECTVTPADVDLMDDTGGFETDHRLVRGLEAPTDQTRRARNRDDRRTGQGTDEQLDRRSLADSADGAAPILLDVHHSLLEGDCIVDRSTARGRKQPDPMVDTVMRCGRVDSSSVAGGREPLDIGPGPRREHE